MNIGTLMVLVRASTIGLGRASYDVERFSRSTAKNMAVADAEVKALNRDLMILSRNMVQLVSLPLAVLAGGAAITFGKYESEITKIIGLVGIARGEAEKWGKEMLQLGPKLGKSPQELAEALYYITSSGFKGAESLNILTESAKASAAGLGDTKNVADIVTSAINAYGESIIDATKVTDILVATVREGKGEPEDLTRSFATVIPIAARLGVSFDQVGGALAAMTRLGISASTSSTYLRQTLFTILKPSSMTRKALAAMGTSAEELRDSLKNKGLLETLLQLRLMTNKYGEEMMGKVFPNIRAFMGITSILASNMDEVQAVFNTTRDSAGMMATAFATASETLQFKWNATLAEGRSMLIKFGEGIANTLLPMLEVATNAFHNVGNWYENLSRTGKEFLSFFTKIAIGIGPLLILEKTFVAIGRGLLLVGVSIGKSIGNLFKFSVIWEGLKVKTEETAVAQGLFAKSMTDTTKIAAVYTKAIQSLEAAYIETIGSKGQLIVIDEKIALTSAQLTELTNAQVIAQQKLATATKTFTITQNQLNNAQILYKNTLATLSKAQKEYNSAKYLAYKPGADPTLKLEAHRKYAALIQMQNIALKQNIELENLKLKFEQAEIEVKIAQIEATNILNRSKAVEAELSGLMSQKLEIENTLRANETKLLKIQAELLATVAAATEANAAATVKATTYSAAYAVQATAVTATAGKAAASMTRLALGFNAVGIAMSKVGTVLAGIGKFLKTNWLIILFIGYEVLSRVIKKHKELAEAQNLQKKVNEAANETIANEVTQINKYLSIAKSEYTTREQKKKAIEDLNKINPIYLSGITQEMIATGKANSVVDTYIKNLYALAEQKMWQAELDQIIAQHIKDVNSGANKQVDIYSKVWAYIKKMGIAMGFISSGISPALAPIAGFYTALKGGKKEYDKWLEGAEKQKALDNEKRFENDLALVMKNAYDHKAIVNDIMYSYTMLGENISKVYDNAAKAEKDFANASKANSKDAATRQAESQTEIKNTAKLVQQQLQNAQGELKFIEEAKSRAAQLGKMGAALSEKERIEFMSLNKAIVESFPNVNKLKMAATYFEKVLEDLKTKYKGKWDEIFVADEEGGFEGLLEGAKNAKSIQEKLNDVFKDFNINIQTSYNKLGLLGEQYDLVAEQAKIYEKAINDILDLQNEAVATKTKVQIDTQQLEQIKYLYQQTISLVYANELWADAVKDAEKDISKAFEDIYYNMMKYKSGTEELLITEKEFGKQLIAIENAARNSGGAFDEVSAKIEIYANYIETLNAKIKKAIINSDTAGLVTNLKELQEALDNLNKLNLIQFQKQLEQVDEKLKLLGSGSEMKEVKLSLLRNELRRLQDIDINLFKTDVEKKKWASDVASLKQQIVDLEGSINILTNLKQGAVDLLTGFAEATGNALAGVKGSFKGLLQTIIQIANDIGKLMVAIGAALVALAHADPTGFLSAGIKKKGTGLIIGGLAIIGAASFATAKMEKQKGMAQGGIVPAGYANDSYPAMLSSGEAVIPPNKLPDFERNPVNVNVTIEGVIKGQDLHYILKEVNRKYQNAY